jgi:acyl-CoA thioesterase
VSDEEALFPLQEWLGFTIDRGNGLATATINLDDRHMNPHGIAHGAVAFALMDTVMGAATMSVIDEGNLCATIEMHTRFHRGATGGQLIATAEVLTAGRKVVHLEAKTHDGDGKLLASATCSYAVLPPAPGDNGLPSAR